MTTILKPVGAVLVVTIVLVALAWLFGPDQMAKPLSAVVVVIALIDCLIVVLMYRVWSRHRDLVVLRSELQNQAMTTIGAILLGAVGVNELTVHHIFPQGMGTVLLLLSLLVISLSPLQRLVTYYRAGR